MTNKNYWCYRINKEEVDFFWNELNKGRLRQGWGWLKGQDLRNFKNDVEKLLNYVTRSKK